MGPGLAVSTGRGALPFVSMSHSGLRGDPWPACGHHRLRVPTPVALILLLLLQLALEMGILLLTKALYDTFLDLAIILVLCARSCHGPF